MLVLSRKTDQRILIGDQVAVTVVRIGRGVVRLGIQAPREVRVLREELVGPADPAKSDDDRTP